jgi:hypothetical protein
MLPKTKYPLFEATLPSNNKTVYYRQMLVKDEKILLIAKSSEDSSDINRAIKQVVNNCLTDDVNVDSLTTFDIEFMFIKIRAVSIGNEIELAFIDSEDNKEYKFTVDLDKIAIKWPEELSEKERNLIIINDDLGFSLQYPPSSLFDDKLASELSKDAYEFIAAKCINKIFEKEEVYSATDYSMDELLEFIENLDIKSYNKVRKFLASTPHLFYEIEYTNEKGTARKIPLTTLTDFFTFQ